MKIICGDLLYCAWQDGMAALVHEPATALAIDASGVICAKGSPKTLRAHFPDAGFDDYSGKFILPGFIDTHIHFPQMDMIGQMAPSLLPWLEQYTLPTEIAFQMPRPLVSQAAHLFVDELLSNGTTMACVYSSSHYEVTDALFEVFASRGLRGIIGKTSMDRQAPATLVEQIDLDLANQERLLKRWHNHDHRLYLALTPRFALTCSAEMMKSLGQCHQQHPGTYIQTHYAENIEEIAAIQHAFPTSLDYLEVYETYGLVGSRTILAHAVHANADAIERIAKQGAIISHCPTSNLFLGSGLFNWRECRQRQVQITLGTDVGAGTSFSLWQTMNEAHKVAALRGDELSSVALFAAATLEAGAALEQGDLGSLEVGFQADLQILDVTRKAILERRIRACSSSINYGKEVLSALIHLSDDRCVESVWVRGKKIR